MVHNSNQKRDWGSSLLPDVLSELQGSGATGTLSVVALGATRDFVFVKGELRAARSSAEHEKLGSWLVAHGVITEVLKQGALLTQEGSDAPPLGHILVTREITTREKLEESLEALALTILQRATIDDRGSCRFAHGLKQGQLDTLPKVATSQLILISARAVKDQEAMRKALGSPDHFVGLTAEVDDVVQAFDLLMPEVVILGKLHRERKLSQLEAMSTLPADQFAPALYALSSAGIVALSPTPNARPASSPVPLSAASVSDSGAVALPSTPAGSANGRSTKNREELVRIHRILGNINHYDLFEISRHAQYREIFSAWENFQRRFGPDKASTDEFSGLDRKLSEVYRHAEEAFQTLSSPVHRPRYDRLLRAPASVKGSSPPGGTADKARASLVQENLKRVDQLIKNKDVYSAIKLLEQTCDLDPRPKCLVKLAKLMLVNPEWTNSALEKLRQAVQLDPTYVDGWLAVAAVWRDRNSRERERKALEQAIASDPNHSEAIARYRALTGQEELQALLDRVHRT